MAKMTIPCPAWPGDESTCGSCSKYHQCCILTTEGRTETVNIKFTIGIPKVDIKAAAAATTKGVVKGMNWTKDLGSKVWGKTKETAQKVVDSKPALAVHGVIDGVIEEGKALIDTVKAAAEEANRK